MDRVKLSLIMIIKKINNMYDLYNSNELDNQLSKIENSSPEVLSKIIAEVIDFTIKNRCYDLFKKYFKEMNIAPSKIDINNYDNYFTNLIVKYLVNSKIDYYLCGGVAVDYVTKGTLQREHQDIDIMINEKDLDSFLETLYGYGLDIEDKRLNQNKGYIANGELIDFPSHDTIAYLSDKFSIGIILFVRDQEGLIHLKRYLLIDDKPYSVQKILSKDATSLLYKKDSKTGIKMESPESIYANKVRRGNGQDLNDIIVLKDIIDYKNVEKIRKLPKGIWGAKKEIKEEEFEDGLSSVSRSFISQYK